MIIKKTLQVVFIAAIGAIGIVGCKSPEEKAMDRFDDAMRKQTYMMKRMQKTMERTDKEIEEMSKP